MRHYTEAMHERSLLLGNTEAHVDLGGAVHVDPEFEQLTPRLLSALETKMW